MRREDDRRKEKRKTRDERKEREREQKEEELKRLKKLKRKEIKEKLEKIKSKFWSHDKCTIILVMVSSIFLAITGNPNVGFSAADLDGDFDPASYDEVMARAFDDSYYTMPDEGEGEGEEEEGKPVFSDDDGEL